MQVLCPEQPCQHMTGAGFLEPHDEALMQACPKAWILMCCRAPGVACVYATLRRAWKGT
jgi:hypothetical protein